MLTIEINGKKLKVERGITIMKACEIAGETLTGTKVGRYCYNERLLIGGNCRMCLVEVEGIGKPVVSCSEEVREGLKVYTETSLVRKSREGVMEFLLLNHPLDCPICDQGGECDLQDESIRVGSERNRSYGHVRKEVTEKDMGSLVKTVMIRCIACSRCVRYISAICGAGELGMVGRGVEVEVSNYINSSVRGNNMVGNVIDLCPVGYVR